MGRIIAYIASSLDGFIARRDDDISWLDPFAAGREDYGYAAFMDTVGAAVMGARTYEQSLLHPDRQLRGLKNYVITRRTLPPATGIEVELWHGSSADLAAKLRRESEKDVYVVGGGVVISRFLDEGLADEIRLFIVPVLLGSGIPLFTGLTREITMTPVETTQYPSGIIGIRYLLR